MSTFPLERNRCIRHIALYLGASCIAAATASQCLAATQPEQPHDAFDFSDIDLSALSARSFVWTETDGFAGLGALPEEMTEEEAFHIEDGNGIIGNASNDSIRRGFVWRPEQGISLLPTEEGSNTGTYDIDTEGRIIGWQESSSGRHAVMWHDGLILRLEDLFSAPEKIHLTEALGFGPQGLILVRIQDESRTTTQLALWHPNQALEVLPPIEGNTPVSASAISADGYVVGQVSEMEIPTGFLWHSQGAKQLLTTPEGAFALDVNSRGTVVGSTAGDQPQAVLWAKDGTHQYLDELVDAALPKGMRLIRAGSINDAGQIAAYGLTPEGSLHLVRLTPKITNANFGTPASKAYFAQDLGEIRTELTSNELAPLSISANGDISGSCSPSAQACPLSEIDIASLDNDITNLFSPNGSVLPLLSSGFTSAGAPVTGTGGPTANQTTLPARQSNFSSPGFSPIVVGSPSTTGSTDGGDSLPPIVSPVPLPASLGLLLSILILLLRPWRTNIFTQLCHRNELDPLR